MTFFRYFDIRHLYKTDILYPIFEIENVKSFNDDVSLWTSGPVIYRSRYYMAFFAISDLRTNSRDP